MGRKIGYLQWLLVAYRHYETLSKGPVDIAFQLLCIEVISTLDKSLIKKFLDIVGKEEEVINFLLTISFRYGEEDIVEYILSLYDNYPNSLSLLKKAIGAKMIRISSLLLNNIKREDVEGQEDDILEEAIKTSNKRIVKVLLDSGKFYPNPDMIDEKHLDRYLVKRKSSPNLEITYMKDIENSHMVEILLEYDPTMDLDVIAENAIQYHRVKVIRVICRISGYFQARDFTREAISSGHIDIVKLILSSYKNPIKNSELLIRKALLQENKEILAYLLTDRRITDNVSRGLMKRAREYTK